MDSSRWSRWTTIAAVLMLAVIAAVVSYSHMFELAQRHGEPSWRAALFPLSVDGMIVASSMALLADARHGRRGGLLPWTLLIVGSAASLCANIAVADPAVWSRIIHAWPSFALIGAYELLMRQFRANAAGVRTEYAERTPAQDDAVTAAEEKQETSRPESAEAEPLGERRHLHVVTARATSEESEVVELVDSCSVPPRIQREAWAWALANRREDGSLPTGKEIADHFAHKDRWGD